MKLLAVLLTSLSMVVSMAMASNPAGPLDGNNFSITVVSTVDNDLPTPDQLVFEGGKADAPVCHKYGFCATPYVANEKDGVTCFSFSCESKTEGSLYFSGVVNDGRIIGTYVWKKEGREDLEYRFEGSVN